MGGRAKGMAKYKVLQEFEHYPTDTPDDAPVPVVAAKGSTVDNIRVDSIAGLTDLGFIVEVASPRPAKDGDA